MFQDDEFEDMVMTPERKEALGFKPQKENLTNHLLPYGKELDEESNSFLEQVKTNFAKAVMLREMKPACGVWSSRLMKYIRLYGFKFSKEDHIALTKLAFELVLIKDLEPCKLHKFATLFLMLMKKPHLISPKEMTLPWRPLYDLGKKLFASGDTHLGLFHYLSNKRSDNSGPSMMDRIRQLISGSGLDDAVAAFGILPPQEEEPESLEGSYINLVRVARSYFELNATKEILAEILPQISPWSTDTHIMCQLCIFLPVDLPPEHSAQGHELWFDQLMTLWDTCYHSSFGISDLMALFSGLARKNPGAIDWSPYVAKMFSKFVLSLNLPVSYKDMQYAKSQSLDTKRVATWIVWTICPDGLVLKQLRSILGGVESYLQSANAGRWSFKLKDLLRKLSREFLTRVRRERESHFKNSWENQTPASYALRDEDITEFVNIVLPPTLQAVYSRMGALDISIALQNLATLRPALVVPPLVEKLRYALTSVTEPHKFTAAIAAITAVARPMLRGAHADYPEGQTHIIPLLMGVLPGLDPNDSKKTLITLHFILAFCGMIPIIDCSSAPEYWTDLTEEELLTCEQTAQFEDFVLIFLDRVFSIIQSSVHEHERFDSKDNDYGRNKLESVIELAMSTTATGILMQCSPKIFQEALRKFKSFATQTTFDNTASGSMIGMLLRCFCRVDSVATLAAFMPELCQELNEMLSSDEVIEDERPHRDVMYKLGMLKSLVECDGEALLKYIPKIIPILDRGLEMKANLSLSRVSEVLCHIFNSLCSIELKEWKSSPKDYGTAPKDWLPIREWGSGCSLKECNFKWHVPSDEEAECAQMLVDRYLKPQVEYLNKYIAGETMCREHKQRSFYIIHAILYCNNYFPPSEEEPVLLMDSQVPATSLPYKNGIHNTVTLDGENMRVALTRLLVQVQQCMLAEKTDDTRSLEILIQVWERLVVAKSLRQRPGLEARLRTYTAMEITMDGRGGVAGEKIGGTRLRVLLAEATRLQEESRADLVCEAGITPSALQGLFCLFELATNQYTSVRIAGQIRLYWLLNHYPYSYRALLPKLSELLHNGGEGEEWHAKLKGALYIMLGPRVGPLVTKQDWEVARALWPAMLKTPLSEKPSIHRLEHALGECLQRNFPAVNIHLTMSDSAIKAAESLLSKEAMEDPKFVEQLKNAPADEIATSNKVEKLYNELIDEIVNVADMQNVPWRRLQLALTMLASCPSVQMPYPPRAVNLVLRMMLHDDIAVRRVSHRVITFMLKQLKRKIKTVMVDPYEVAGLPRPEKHIPGYRKDLEWAMWKKDGLPETHEEWNKPWLRNPNNGFYAWPEKIKVAAPSEEQNHSFNLPPEKMEESERMIYEFFTDENNVDRLIGFLTAEDKKGKDKFNAVRFSMFRLLFSHYGRRVADKIVDAAGTFAKGSLEAPQRFASEVVAAAIRAPRDWPREEAAPFYRTLAGIVETALTTVIPETMEDWGTSFATGMEKVEPHRASDILNTLLDLCLPPPSLADLDIDRNTSFLICARLYALQAALGALCWRVAPLAAEVLSRIEATNFIQHPYQNVRDSVGSVLMTVFDMEIVFPGGSAGPAPQLAHFLGRIKPRLAALYDENGNLVVKTTASTAFGSTPTSCDKEAFPTADVNAVTVAALHDNNDPLPEDEHNTQLPSADGTPQTPESSGAEVAVVKASGSKPNSNLELVKEMRRAMHSADNTAAQPEKHAKALNTLIIVLRTCMGIIVRNVNGSIEAHYELVPTACATASPMPQDELPRAAVMFLASLVLASHTDATFDKALDVLEEIANGKSWGARLASVDFAQPLVFYGLPMLCERPERAVRAERFAMKMMRDPRIEVRQAASKLLTGLMHCRALPDENLTIKSLMHSCRSKVLLEKHCGVLGLCAYLASRPYSLGSRLGDVLTELAKYTNAPDPIPDTIRIALAEFRRTHQDDWPKHREKLTEEELDLLADLTSPPSYCA